MVEEKKLTAKQARFVSEYLIDFNATQAAIRAGYSKNTAKETGYENLTKPYIARAIEEATKKYGDENEELKDRVLKEYAKLGFSNMGDFVTWDDDGVDIVSSEDLTEAQTACVSEISQTFIRSTKDGETVNTPGTLKFKLHDKKGSLDSMARHLGMFNDSLLIKGLSDSDRLRLAGEELEAEKLAKAKENITK